MKKPAENLYAWRATKEMTQYLRMQAEKSSGRQTDVGVNSGGDEEPTENCMFGHATKEMVEHLRLHAETTSGKQTDTSCNETVSLAIKRHVLQPKSKSCNQTI